MTSQDKVMSSIEGMEVKWSEEGSYALNVVSNSFSISVISSSSFSTSRIGVSGTGVATDVVDEVVEDTKMVVVVDDAAVEAVVEEEAITEILKLLDTTFKAYEPSSDQP